jgi:hypothetical protein
MKKSTAEQSTARDELLPPGPLRIKWTELLNAKRNERDAAKREHQFQFAHGWLKGLEDAGVLSHGDLPELRELLIAAKPN